jgi:hypothetical protein
MPRLIPVLVACMLNAPALRLPAALALAGGVIDCCKKGY